MIKEFELRGREFRIELKEFCFGWQHIILRLDSVEIPFHPSYIGCEPLSTLIDSVLELDNEPGDFYIKWAKEPGYLEITLERTGEKLSMHAAITDADFFDKEKEGGTFNEEWKVVMDYTTYREAVIDYGLRQLKHYGLNGHNRNWLDGWDSFPMNGLMRLLGTESRLTDEEESYHSDIFDELEILIQRLRAIE